MRRQWIPEIFFCSVLLLLADMSVSNLNCFELLTFYSHSYFITFGLFCWHFVFYLCPHVARCTAAAQCLSGLYVVLYMSLRLHSWVQSRDFKSKYASYISFFSRLIFLILWWLFWWCCIFICDFKRISWHSYETFFENWSPQPPKQLPIIMTCFFRRATEYTNLFPVCNQIDANGIVISNLRLLLSIFVWFCFERVNNLVSCSLCCHFRRPSHTNFGFWLQKGIASMNERTNDWCVLFRKRRIL